MQGSPASPVILGAAVWDTWMSTYTCIQTFSCHGCFPACKWPVSGSDASQHPCEWASHQRCQTGPPPSQALRGGSNWGKATGLTGRKREAAIREADSHPHRANGSRWRARCARELFVFPYTISGSFFRITGIFTPERPSKPSGTQPEPCLL